MKAEIAVLGENQNVMLFNGVGVTPYVVRDRAVLVKRIDELAEAGTKLIIVSDIFQEALKDTLDKYQLQSFPIILLLPLGGYESSKGLDKIKADVERAIGINIF